ncbi:MAG: alkaline phosphatase family protein [Proteobacteria bacterium]|nr:alkaline phosphatase family protein [Cystobacterineae bacterium]MCL2258431.1 alkaline phosphatase family protein [Cystobacterineae bacterium]MCL2315223.1 alkaline phosphatase family protein [Pseudomonadota bacterium]
MKRLAAFALCLLLLSACDWEHSALMNSIPVRPKETPGKTIHVFLGLDGIAWNAAQEAMHRGAFSSFHLSKIIPMFPATSDASWTRILHTKSLSGYEFTYYDPHADTVRYAGLLGVALHGLPYMSPAYYSAFDVHGSDYLDTVLTYDEPQASLGKNWDNFFFVLGDRLATTELFSGYVPETDVLGHYEDKETVVSNLQALSARMDEFIQRHKNYHFIFTIYTDHGLDHVVKPTNNIIRLEPLLEEVGINVVHSFHEGLGSAFPWVVPIEHTRVPYAALHTMPNQIPTASARLSSHPSVDMIVARGFQIQGAPENLRWTNLWKNGTCIVHIGYSPTENRYWLSGDIDVKDWEALDVALTLPPAGQWKDYSDEELFRATLHRRYPDLFFRARTSLEAISVKYPADILISFSNKWLMQGFSFPLAPKTVGASGSHGAMDYSGSEGALLTQAPHLPPVLRSDDFLSFYPEFREWLARKKLLKREPMAPLRYEEIFP